MAYLSYDYRSTLTSVGDQVKTFWKMLEKRAEKGRKKRCINKIHEDELGCGKNWGKS